MTDAGLHRATTPRRLPPPSHCQKTHVSGVTSAWYLRVTVARALDGGARYWWEVDGVRPVWVEITRRPNDDIGVDLNHDNPRTFPLLKAALRGDYVLHWDSKRGCFVGRSRIADSTVVVRSGNHRRDLSDFIQFPESAVTLDALRKNYKKIRTTKKRLEARVTPGTPLQFPVAPYGGTWAKLRPQLNYLTVAPPDFVSILGAIYEAHRRGDVLYRSWSDLGLRAANGRSRCRHKDRSIDARMNRSRLTTQESGLRTTRN